MGDANQATAVCSHEVHCFRSHFFGGHYQVAFVLAIGIVRHYDNAPLGDVAYHIVNRVELKRLFALEIIENNTITSYEVLSNYSCSCFCP